MTMFLEPFAFEMLRHMASDGTRTFVPAADVVVADDEVTVYMDLPGLTADDVTIDLRDDVLTIRGERPLPYRSDDQDSKAWQRIERGFGTFERQLRLTNGLDPDAITASLADGVLTLHIPKPQERKPRRIKIATGSKTETIEGTATDQRELAGSAA
jgi:HSP20 family protein